MGCLTCKAVDDAALRDGNLFEPYSSGIRLLGPPAGLVKLRAWLDQLKKTPTGSLLLQKIDDDARVHGGKPVTIAYIKDARLDQIGAAGFERGDTGTASSFQITPDGVPHYERGTPMSSEKGYIVMGDVADQPKTPGGVALGHELIHLDHYMNGEGLLTSPDPSDTGDLMGNQEESRTIGIDAWTKNTMSENQIRREWGNLPLRTTHGSLP